MFARGHFAGTYFAPTYFPPGFGLRKGGGPPEEEGGEEPSGRFFSKEQEAYLLRQRLLERLREPETVPETVEARIEPILPQKAPKPVLDEDEALLLLLSDPFGSIGNEITPLISISDDDLEALLLAVASDHA